MPCARIRVTVVVGVLLMLGPLHQCPLMASWSGLPRLFPLRQELAMQEADRI